MGLRGNQRQSGNQNENFSAYCPVPGGGPDSVYSQHERHWQKLGQYRNPILAFDEDLEKEIKTAQTEGAAIIILIDTNEDVRAGSFSSTIQKQSIRETITKIHGAAGPETYLHNTKNKPIDGIFTSPSIAIETCGYWGYKQSFGQDHRVIWTQMKAGAILGMPLVGFERRKTKKLNTKNSHSVTKYNATVKELFASQGIFDQMEAVQHGIDSEGWSPKLEAQYNKIHAISYAQRKQAESKLRTVGLASVSWFPAIARSIKTIKYWSSSLDQVQSKSINAKTLFRSSLRLNISARNMTLMEIQTQLDLAFEKYKREKRHTDNSRNFVLATG